MAGRDYTLDFTGTSGIPSQWGIDTAFVTRFFHRQTSGLDGVMMTPARSRGVFNVVALTAEAAKILSSFKLKVEKDGKKFDIPLRERRRRNFARDLFSTPPRGLEDDISSSSFAQCIERGRNRCRSARCHSKRCR